MHADAAFVIGRGHGICQDYTRSGATEGGSAYGIVCDGCSSSPDTDIGARLLALAAEAYLQRLHQGLDLDHLGVYVARMAYIGGVAAGITSTDAIANANPLDATLLVVAALPNARPVAMLWGDGAAATKENGILHTRILSFPGNAPAYPSYGLNLERAATWVRSGANKALLEELDADTPMDVDPMRPTYQLMGSADGGIIVVFSDGVSSFRDAQGVPISPFLIVERLMAFKTTAGVFVQRRLRAFERECAVLGWTHHDDLAMAAIHTEEVGF